MKPTIVHRRAGHAVAVLDPSMPPLLQRVYRHRGIDTLEALDNALGRLPTPETFKGMEAAIDLLVDVTQQKQRICVIGDFDADGATSTALAIHALRSMGFAANFLVPNRFKYGYGLTPEIVEVAWQQQRPDLIVTVDNGISSIEGVRAAHERGMRVLITDHHLPGRELPDADAMVNPNQPGCNFPCKRLAGVGVIFYVLSALRTRLRDINYFKDHAIAEPRMADYLDLVALGTVADVVSLDHTNRILVKQGVNRIRAGRSRPGVMALVEVAKRECSRLVAEDLAFAVAPRLNAAGRMQDMSTGIRCLLADEHGEAQQLAAELDELNRSRRRVEKDMQSVANQIVETLKLTENGLPQGLCVFREDWHQGVVGLIASRLKERYHRPVIAFAPADDNNSGLLKGSARSIEGLHIRDALEAIATEQPSLIDRFGGHAMAAGLSLPREQLPDFQLAFNMKVHSLLDDSAFEAVLLSDGELEAGDWHLDTARALREGGPWGQHFPPPLFHGRFVVLQKRILTGQHLKLLLQPVSTPTAQPVDGILFFADADLQQQLTENMEVTAAFRLDVNHYQGCETLQLVVEYLGIDT